MAYPIDGKVGIDLSLVSSNRNFTLGTVLEASDGGQYIFAYNVAAISTGMCVVVDAGFTAAAITTALARTRNPLAFAQVTIAASSYAWYAKNGTGIKIRTAASTIPGVSLYTSDTAGVLDDLTASISHFQVFGVVLFATQAQAGATSGAASWPLVRNPA